MWAFGLRQGCVLSPLLFITYMKWIDKRSQTNECVGIGSFKISRRLLFADNLVLLADSESGLQRALDKFAAACDTAGIKISTTKTVVLHLSRNPVHGVPLSPRQRLLVEDLMLFVYAVSFQ